MRDACSFVLPAPSSKCSNALSKHAWLRLTAGAERTMCGAARVLYEVHCTAPPRLRRGSRGIGQTRLRNNRLSESLFSVVIFLQGSRTSSHSANYVQFVNFTSFVHQKNFLNFVVQSY